MSRQNMKVIAADLLQSGADIFRERNAVYGNNFFKVGPIFAALFPDGLLLKTPEDFNRFHLLMLDVVKTTRYSENWDKGGHDDSLADKAVYSAMLQALDMHYREPAPAIPLRGEPAPSRSGEPWCPYCGRANVEHAKWCSEHPDHKDACPNCGRLNGSHFSWCHVGEEEQLKMNGMVQDLEQLPLNLENK